MSLNHCVFMGRLTNDPEVRYTQQTNVCVASFTLAVDRQYTKEGQQNTDFINIVAWNKTAEFIGKYFTKGMLVAVHGKLQTRNYDNKDGKKVYVTEVIAEDVYFAEKKATETQPQASEPAEGENLELPF